ncbi:MAG: ribbon-helix-helix protein, CopG family [Actinobacteria bacterium]|nr:ribbon-helix-helix protein, CopG family [Actinomycetota bacterium]
MHRTQIYLSDEQERALADRAERLGRTKSALIREAIDRYLEPAAAEQTALARLRTAVAEAHGCASYLPAGERYVEDLRAADRERARELDERRER